MEEELINRYNALVGPNDKVLFLGDCFFLPFLVAKEITQSLNGQKYLLRGNHDKSFKDAQFKEMGFLDIYPKYFKSSIDGIPVYYSHYPFAGYSQDMRHQDKRPPRNGTVIVHGHTHDTVKLTSKNTVHVGVDAWDYYPAPIEEVTKLVKKAQKGGGE
jgi:calcineurin-like phosphoesterase family protein